MKTNFIALCLCFNLCLFSQSNTEVYLFNVSVTDGDIKLSKPLNISNNDGYDNQPSFYNDNVVLFSSTRNNQTDIAKYNIRDNILSYVNSTPIGSEYSPLKIPNQKAISAIRLDTSGLQRLYRYDFETGKNDLLVKDLVIGYHTWLNKNEIASFVLGDESSLVISNLKDGSSRTLAKNIGRSLHRIPNSNLFSYIDKSEAPWKIMSMNPETGESQLIINAVSQSEDMCWLINGTALMTRANSIYKFNPKTDTNWSVFKTFEDANLQNLTRISSNEIGTLLSVVSEVSPEMIVQKQLEAYNARDIDAFMATYASDVKIFTYPNILISEGQEAMKPGYEGFFKNTPDLHCEILERIVIGNKVIDHEYVTANGNSFKAVAVYEVENGLISKVTFIR